MEIRAEKNVSDRKDCSGHHFLFWVENGLSYKIVLDSKQIMPNFVLTLKQTMEALLQFQNNLLAQLPRDWHRYLFTSLPDNERLMGIKGLRGVGKTTLMLQYLAQKHPRPDKGLYVTADHPYFYDTTLFDLAGSWYSLGGDLLLVDEVHKYPNWSRELKLIYDGHPGLQIIFTSSSALDLYRGESDLSRRLRVHTLHGLSFREYLSLIHDIQVDPVSLVHLLEDHMSLAGKWTRAFKPLEYFGQYLSQGYFPFANEIAQGGLSPRFIQILNTVLESDLSHIEDFNAANVQKIKKLLGVIAGSVPFEPNISKIAERLGLGRVSVLNYLKNLSDASVVNLLNRPQKGMSHLQKPDKIYFENTCFSIALSSKAEIGTLRETFALNQLKNAGHQVELGERGDFLIDGLYTFEIGGKGKNFSQVKGLDNAYLAVDDIEVGFGKKLPLWMLGMLY